MELKPCPFCDAGEDFVGAAYGVGCANCGAEGPHGKTEAEAIAAWNTRPAPTEADVEAAAKRMWEVAPNFFAWDLASEAVHNKYFRMARAALGVE